MAGNLHSQTAPVKNLDFFVNKTASEYDEEKKRTFIYRLLGDQVKSSVTIMRIATHIFLVLIWSYLGILVRIVKALR